MDKHDCVSKQSRERNLKICKKNTIDNSVFIDKFLRCLVTVNSRSKTLRRYVGPQQCRALGLPKQHHNIIYISPTFEDCL